MSEIQDDFNYKRLCSLLRELPQERQEQLLKELDREHKEHVERKEAYRVEDIALLLGISVYTIRKWLREGKIKARKIGKLWLVPRAEIEKLLTVDDGE